MSIFDRTRERMMDAAARAFLRVVDGKREAKPPTSSASSASSDFAPPMEGMRRGKSFDEYIATHPKRKADPPPLVSPFGIPGVFEDDARFIKAAMGRGKWSDVKYYGPGAAAAEARRRETIERMTGREAGPLVVKEETATAARGHVLQKHVPVVDALARKTPRASKKKGRETLAERVERVRREFRNAT